jgi:hypothetical protein
MKIGDLVKLKCIVAKIRVQDLIVEFDRKEMLAYRCAW